MKRTIVWERLDSTSVEHLVLSNAGNGKIAVGHIVGVLENKAFAIAYQIEIAAEWKVSAFKIIALDAPEQTIAMRSDESGRWFDGDGNHQTQFDGCFDIDLTLTPFTNTLPIKRLDFAAGERKKIAVLYIELPEFNIKRVEQFYTKLGEKIYRYAGYPKDFRAEIVFDEDDLVIDYPKIFRRVYPKN